MQISSPDEQPTTQVALQSAPTAPIDDPIEQSAQAIEDLMPAVESRKLTFPKWKYPTGEIKDASYIQEPLGFFGIQELNKLLAKTIKGFMAGEHGIKLGDLFSREVRQQMQDQLPTDFDSEAVNKAVDDNRALLFGFIHLVEILPDLQLELMCLSLGVPRNQRDWVKAHLVLPPSQGGLTTEAGFNILGVFVEQNAPELRRFFGSEGRKLVSKIQAAMPAGDQSTSETTEDPIEGTMATASSEPSATETEAWTRPEDPSSGGMPSSTSSQPIPEND